MVVCIDSIYEYSVRVHCLYLCVGSVCVYRQSLRVTSLCGQIVGVYLLNQNDQDRNKQNNVVCDGLVLSVRLPMCLLPHLLRVLVSV